MINEKTDLLGEIVSWDMHGNEVAYADVRQSLRDAGLEEDEAAELTTQAAFTRACKHLKENRQIDKLKSDHGVISFQFTQKHCEDNEIQFDRECTVEVDVDTGEIRCDEKPELAEQAKKLLDYAMQTRSPQDITRIVQKLFKNHADLYAINSKGSAYFCPERFRDFSASVDKFITSMGGTMRRFPVPKGTDAGNASVRDAVASGITSLVDELENAVEGWDDKTRESTMENVQKRFEQISFKVDAYAEYLLGEQESLRLKLEEAKKRMVDRMIQLHEEDEKADAGSELATA